MNETTAPKQVNTFIVFSSGGTEFQIDFIWQRPQVMNAPKEKTLVSRIVVNRKGIIALFNNIKNVLDDVKIQEAENDKKGKGLFGR